jgi:L-iditol 2-dehydrogenase
MRACVLHGVRQLEVRDVPAPAVGPHDVLVRVQAVGLCGTDLHIFGGDANYNLDERGQPVPLERHPQILGHEITGVVEEAGDRAAGVRAGERVVLDQGLNCVSRRETPCEYCASGDSHQCERYREHGITGAPGGLAELIAVPAVNAVPLATDLDPAQAALAEPLACVVHATEALARAGGARYALGAADSARRVRTVLVLGAGPAGLLFVQYLRRVLGFDGRLLASEPNAHKRELAAGFGAEAIDPSAGDVVAALRERTDGRLAELVIESSGAGAVFPLLPGLVRKQGTVLLYGHGRAGVDLSVLNGLQFKEPCLVSPVGGSGGFDADGRPAVYRRALRLLEQGTVRAGPIVSHRYAALEDVERALGRDAGQPGYVKGVVVPG